MKARFPRVIELVSDDDLRAMLTTFEGPSEPVPESRGRSVRSRPQRSALLIAAALVALILSVPALAFHSRIGEAIDAVLGNTVYPTPVQGTFADLAANVSAIDRPRGPEDVLTREAAAAAAGFADRLPIDAENRSMKVFTAPPTGPVYVLPAKDGFAFITARTGGIVPGTLGKSDPTAGATVYGSDGGLVFGVVSDDVTAVDVVIGKDVFSATMVHNGFYWTAPNAPLDVGSVSVRAHLKDGSVVSG